MMNNRESYDLKLNVTGRNSEHSFFIILFSAALSVILNAAVCYYLSKTIHPHLKNMDELTSIYIQAVFAEYRPEPLERMIFIISLILIPTLIILSQLLLSKYIDSLKMRFDIDGISLAATTLTILIILAFIPIRQYFDFYDYRVVLVTCFSIFSVFYIPKISTKTSRLVSFLLILTLLTIIITYASKTIFDLCDIENGYISYHFQSVMYSAVQVFQGKALLVDFKHQYGLYAHIMEPLFTMFGFDVLKFTIFMSVLKAFAFILVSIFLLNILSNKYIAFLGALAVVYYSSMIITTYPFPGNEPYFQYHPIRILFPTVLIFFGWKFIDTGDTRLYWIILITNSISTIWNMDTGIVCFLGWLFTLCHYEFINGTFKTGIRRTLAHSAAALVTLSAIWAVFSIYFKLRYGSLPDYAILFIYQRTFLDGHMQLPMPILHPWLLVALTFVTGLSISCYSFIFKKSILDKKRVSITFLLTMLGIGMFSYYQGRSHDLSLIGPLICPILLATIYLDTFVVLIRKDQRISVSSGSIFILLVIIVWFLSGSIIGTADDLSEKAVSSRNITSILTRKCEGNSIEENNVAFIKNITVPGQKILIISNHTAIYYLYSGTLEPTGVSEPTVFLFKKDLEILKQFLLSDDPDSCKIIIDENIPIVFRYKDLDLQNMLRLNYKLIDRGGSLLLFEKKSDLCSSS